MANVVKTQMAKVRNNPVGLVVGGVATYFVAKKYGKVTKTWHLVALAVAGAVVGAHVNSYIKAKQSEPTKSIVLKGSVKTS
jgi:outer membrane lipoprotein SlyB